MIKLTECQRCGTPKEDVEFMPGLTHPVCNTCRHDDGRWDFSDRDQKFAEDRS